MKLSVVVASRDRREALAECLDALAAMPPPPGGMEVIVVDDGSLDPIELTTDSGDNEFRLVRRPGEGLAAARNHGLGETRGEIVAFLDDDAVPVRGWARAIDAGFSRGFDALGGPVVLDVPGGIPDWVSQKQLSYLSHYDLGEETREVGRQELPFGANVAFRRDVLVALDGFRARLGRAGAELTSNEETEVLRRLLADGRRVGYHPDARVSHRISPARLSKDWLRERAAAQGVSDARMEPTGPRADGVIRWMLLTRELVRTVRDLPDLAGRLARERQPMDLVLWIDYCRGRRDELRRLRFRVDG